MCPDIRSHGLVHAKSPAPAVDIAAVLPDRSKPLLEEVDGLSHLDLLDGGVVIVAPEVLHRLDLCAELLEVWGVGLGTRGLGWFLVPGLPGDLTPLELEAGTRSPHFV